MDNLDHASALEMKQTQMAISSQQQSSKSKFVVSAVNCVACDEVIPSARRLAIPGCQYCIYCQALAEKGRL
ncbi:MAG: phage/conjugal plasmid C-4 type zinc finger TraR family protein [Psychromonas sp.]|jgi:phage/conjugal plasmid C-4 type zinc finger TraR family protein|uniref:TraR/DksA C4-type zinc finger protein n=1 Tax=Psychromonas sp. TaxID=1884585 RepID=UPI0039E573E5